MSEQRSIEGGSARQPRHLVVGTLVGVSRWIAGALDRSADTTAAPEEPHGPALPFIAVGLLCAAEERLTDAARTAAGTARFVGGTVADLTAPLVPAPVRRAVAQTATDLDRQGRAAASTGADEAARIGNALATGLARQAALVHLIEDVVDRLQWRVVDAVLPVVLDRLAEEPEQVRVIVQGQSRGMVDELAHSARNRAVDGDELVDRVVGRLLGGRRPPRRTALASPTSPAALPVTAQAEP